MNPYNKNPLDEIRQFFVHRTMLSNLILINVGVWLLVKITDVFLFLNLQPGTTSSNEWLLPFLAVPAYIPSLIKVPWSPLTYMFLHYDFWHILFNMLWLFWFGKIFIQYLSSRQLLQTYLIGGFTGAFFYIAAFNFFPVFQASLPLSYALGASASVMAIVTAISFYVPNYTIQLLFIGRVKIIYLAIILFIFDFFAIPGNNSGGHIAHIGGALWGFAYILLVRKGFGSLFSINSSGWINAFRKKFSTGRHKQSSSYNFNGRPVSDEEYNLEKKAKQKKIDEILEKISKGGYESLTKSEKEFLFKSSGKTK
jgi:membrane associated rhomboid family serine protease